MPMRLLFLTKRTILGVVNALSPSLFQGREGAEIEPWEDADYLVYKVTDRFGFLQ